MWLSFLSFILFLWLFYNFNSHTRWAKESNQPSRKIKCIEKKLLSFIKILNIYLKLNHWLTFLISNIYIVRLLHSCFSSAVINYIVVMWIYVTQFSDQSSKALLKHSSNSTIKFLLLLSSCPKTDKVREYNLRVSY